MADLEVRVKQLEASHRKHEALFKEHAASIEALKETVEEHERRWNKIRTYELINNRSQFDGLESFKPRGIISLERREIVHGGDVLRDLQALKSAESKLGKENLLVASRGFEGFYGLSADQYGPEILKSHQHIRDVLDIKSNLQNLYLWETHKDKQDLLNMADSIIEKWKYQLEGGSIYRKCDLVKDYEILRVRYQSARK